VGFEVKKRNVPIEKMGLSHQLTTGITYSLTFEGYEACVWAGLDLERWANYQYDRLFMVKVVAQYRLHNMIEAHNADEQTKAQKRAVRKAKRRRR
jgi:hypothetical protein